MAKGFDDSRPLIQGSVDLVQLDSHQRTALIGREAWLQRREFLRYMLGTSALFFGACDGTQGNATGSEPSGSGGSGTTNGPTGGSSSAGSCQTGSPRVVGHEIDGTVGATFANLDFYGTAIDIYFDRKMNGLSLASAVTITPAPPAARNSQSSSFAVGYYDNGGTSSVPGSVSSAWLAQPPSPSSSETTGPKLHLEPATTYTVTVSASALDACGNSLGSDYVFTFQTSSTIDCSACPSDAGDSYGACATNCPCATHGCSCQANTCTCQAYSCSCQSYSGCGSQGDCIDKGCPLNGL